jgi:uncharacterized membrane protein YfcA
MIILGLSLSLLIGVLLGLLGGGGSILTVPLLHYVFGFEATLAVFLSLFIVGMVALVGAALHQRQGLVRWKQGLIFAIPSFAAVFLTRKFLIPLIPNEISLLGLSVSKGTLTLFCFGVVMMIAGFAMVRKPKVEEAPVAPQDDERKMSGSTGDQTVHRALIAVASRGALVGVVTGFVGAGGGFLIVPALTLLLGFEMKAAVGTSLAIISFNSLGGFFSEFMSNDSTDRVIGSNPALELGWLTQVLPGGWSQTPWALMLLITFLSIIGMFAGMALQKRVSGATLKPAFGYFVLVSALLIMLKEAM